MLNSSLGKGRSSELAHTKETVCRRLSGRDATAVFRANVSVSRAVTRPAEASESPGQPPVTAADLQHIRTGESSRFFQVEYFCSFGVFLNRHKPVPYFFVFLFTGGFSTSAGST